MSESFNANKSGSPCFSTSDKSFYIGAYNRNGTADNFSIRETAFNSIGDGLTDTQASDFYTSVQTFQTTLSRQV